MNKIANGGFYRESVAKKVLILSLKELEIELQWKRKWKSNSTNSAKLHLSPCVSF